MNLNVLGAVFRRNFLSYFLNPTGYLFICVFVLLSTFTAFCTNEFFNANLANLGQLNKYFPLIMLVFIPAITMAMWADERRQGTDELLLTIPGGDFDIVFGKFLAAVAIYTVALVFSAICHLVMLRWLGQPDLGLFAGTYAGYWLVGIAMLAIGMVASFLTGNLTIGYILGLVFNVPLVMAAFADNTMSVDKALLVKRWSIAEQFADFGRGVISLSGVTFFLMIVAVMLYLAMVLIGRRHWLSGVSGMPGWLFYLLVHVPWLISFIGLGWALQQHYTSPAAQTTIWAGLAVGYLVLHALFLAVWSSRPAAQHVSMLQILVPIMQLVAGGLFLCCLVMYQSRLLEAGTKLYLLLAAYGAVHVILILLWLVTPPAASLVPGHYVLRTLMLVALAVTVHLFFQAHDVRWDVTAEKLSSLSPDTTKLLSGLKLQRPLQIEAFVSPQVPEAYVPLRLNLLSMLRELQAYGGEKIHLRINDTERYSEEAARAERRYGITSRPVMTVNRGVQTEEHIFMGVAFTSGLQKVIIPFIDRGIPVEYELVRSICTVSQQEKKKIGVLTTDAQLYGGFNMQTMANPGNWPIIDELEKQYDLVQVDPNQPITEKYAALLAVQPSSLTPPQMDNFIAAVQNGQPTAIFEDPFPSLAGNVPATSAPKQPPQQQMMMGMGNPEGAPKGDIGKLWQLLGVDFSGDKIVWQHYNPYRKANFPEEFVFVDNGCGARQPFGKDSAISSGLQHLLFPFPGAISGLRASNLKFTPLVRTGELGGTENYNDMFEGMPFMQRQLRESRPRFPTRESYIMAAEISGKIKPPQMMAADKPADAKTDKPADVKADKPVEAKPAGAKAEPAAAEKPAVDVKPAEANAADKPADVKPLDAKAADKPADVKPAEPAPVQPPKTPEKPKEVEIHVVVVADIDMLSRPFFRLRELGQVPEWDLNFDFDNVTFVLNALDVLAGDTSFVEIRKRRPAHRTLTTIDTLTESFKQEADDSRREFVRKFDEGKSKEQKLFDDKLKELQGRTDMNDREKIIEVAMAQRVGQARLTAINEQLEHEKDREVNRIETELNLKIRSVQDFYKRMAVIFPPLFPLALAVVVLVIRRVREREGVSRRRLR
jgi:ABC-2 type transport system permease protein